MGKEGGFGAYTGSHGNKATEAPGSSGPVSRGRWGQPQEMLLLPRGILTPIPRDEGLDDFCFYTKRKQ